MNTCTRRKKGNKFTNVLTSIEFSLCCGFRWVKRTDIASCSHDSVFRYFYRNVLASFCFFTHLWQLNERKFSDRVSFVTTRWEPYLHKITNTDNSRAVYINSARIFEYNAITSLSITFTSLRFHISILFSTEINFVPSLMRKVLRTLPSFSYEVKFNV